MKYPQWFPYPVCWIKSLALLVYLTISLRITVFWGAVGTSISFVNADAFGSSNFMPIIAGMITPFILLVVIHHIMIGAKSTSDWFPRWASWRTGINALIVWVVACLIGGIISLPFSSRWYGRLTLNELDNEVLLCFAIIWIAAGYLYHYDYLVRQSRKQKRMAKAKS